MNGTVRNDVTALNTICLNDNYAHTFCTNTVWESGFAFSGEDVTLNVNSTVYTFETDASGCFSKSLDLEPRNNLLALYDITASFSGDQPVNAAAWACTLDGTQFAACTTVQYGYKPATNSTTLTVIPQSTDTTTVTGTPEQMQKQAQDSGWMPPPKNEFSWWYPWYRLHFLFTPNGVVEYDYGISPLPFGNTLQYSTFLKNTLTNFWLNANYAIVSAIALAEFQGFVASELDPPGFLAAIAISFSVKLATLAANWNSVEGLESIFVGSLVSTVLGVVKCIAVVGLEGIIKISQGITDLADVGFGTLYSMISVPINIVFQIAVLMRLAKLGVNVF